MRDFFSDGAVAQPFGWLRCKNVPYFFLVSRSFL